MMDKRLLALVPGAMRHVLATVGWQWLGLVGNVLLSWEICRVVGALLLGTAPSIPEAALALAVALVARLASTRLSARESFAASQDVKGALRRRIYEKLLRLGTGYAQDVSTAEVVQLSAEGCEQLETYWWARQAWTKWTRQPSRAT